MFCDKENVNQLTALLMAHDVTNAVVCPGSRNAPIVHNLNECPQIACHPVTDERSAGFVALGMAQRTGEKVVVCVTSGTALLNLAPAVAEAYYQQMPVIVVSADRPAQWIDQQDGQTLPQPGALDRFVRKSVSLVEPANDEQRWHNNCLVNEAMLSAIQGPVHINVPISEPLFRFTQPVLPDERVVHFLPFLMPIEVIIQRFTESERPMLIYGQPMNKNFDEAVYLVENKEEYVPYFVLYVGGSIVSKRLKRFLRRARETWIVNAQGEFYDTFMNLTCVAQNDGDKVVELLNDWLRQAPHPFVEKWRSLLSEIERATEVFEPPYSQMATVKYLEKQPDIAVTHYANSMPIRLANIYSHHPLVCNRGVNGIEGSLSTAVGCSLATDDKVVCIAGDLSFFYDQNALWNQRLRGNLRILLLNNGGGGIFRQLPGLELSPARDALVSAVHHTTAEGICMQNRVDYRMANDMETMHRGIDWLIHTASDRPLLLEVFTDATADAAALGGYYEWLVNI